MHNRIVVAVGAVLTATGLTACTTTPSTAQIASTATVTVNGFDARMPSVRCGQLDWTRTIDIGGTVSGASVVLDEHADPLKALSVHILNVGNFTGMYSQGGPDEANANLSGDTFTITGNAEGSKADKANEPASAKFKIVAKC